MFAQQTEFDNSDLADNSISFQNMYILSSGNQGHTLTSI